MLLLEKGADVDCLAVGYRSGGAAAVYVVELDGGWIWLLVLVRLIAVLHLDGIHAASVPWALSRLLLRSRLHLHHWLPSGLLPFAARQHFVVLVVVQSILLGRRRL